MRMLDLFSGIGGLALAAKEGRDEMILHGDVKEKLKEIADGTVQCVVTSPPYW